MLHDTEMIAGIKPVTDVLLLGSARSHRGPVRALTAALRVGPTAKSVQVWGDRELRLERRAALEFSAPEPFTVMPLTWEHAYGGEDTYAESMEPKVPDTGLHAISEGLEPTLGSLSYPRNPHGRGFFMDLDRERLAGAPVPNLDDPSDPVSPDRMLVRDYLDWIDCPVATCFEPIDLFTFPRALFFVPADFNKPARPIHELTMGALAPADLARMDGFDASIHPRSFNCAPAGLATHRLYGAERVQLWNLHPERELFEFDLAGDRPRLVIEPPGVRPREVEPLLQTVLIEPDLDRVTLTWAGAIEVAAVYPHEMTDVMRHAVVFGR
ncbi:putative exported protein [Minicystis rosea]|nr:putative exported protein [Minicystis rosea]